MTAAREAARRHLLVEDFLDGAWPEYTLCVEGQCEHVTEGLVCEYAREREEAFEDIDPTLAGEMEIALYLARRYKRYEEPREWSIGLGQLVLQARIAMAHHDRSKRKAQEVAAANGNGRPGNT